MTGSWHLAPFDPQHGCWSIVDEHGELVAECTSEKTAQEIIEGNQIVALVDALMLADHLHTRRSIEFDHAYYRLCNAMVGNPWLAPGEPNPLAAAPAAGGER